MLTPKDAQSQSLLPLNDHFRDDPAWMELLIWTMLAELLALDT